jgi:pimeloyl-ACP methyl ester carboxylesterase
MKLAQKIIINYYRAKLNFMAVLSPKWAAKSAFALFCTPYRKPRNVPPPIFEKCNLFSLEIENQKLWGYSWNENADKKALIIHGFESRAYQFDRYIGPLLKKGYAVYAMDAKAHGRSDGKTIVLPEYVAMIKGLTDKVGNFDAYISHSFGGMAISLFLEKYPNPEAKVVLLAPATETATAIRFFCTFFQLGPQVKREIENLVKQKSGKEVSFYSMKRIIPALSNHILWIHDTDDDITPYHDMEPLIHAELKHVEFMITDGLGHRRIYKENKVVKKVIEFL